MEWKELHALNHELVIYANLTKSMEGNGPTGSLVLPKYLKLKESIKEKINEGQESDPLYPFFCAILKRLCKYLGEAMKCKTLILATIMHPCV